jgi:hypothetical protein
MEKMQNLRTGKKLIDCSKYSSQVQVLYEKHALVKMCKCRSIMDIQVEHHTRRTHSLLRQREVRRMCKCNFASGCLCDKSCSPRMRLFASRKYKMGLVQGSLAARTDSTTLVIITGRPYIFRKRPLTDSRQAIHNPASNLRVRPVYLSARKSVG